MGPLPQAGVTEELGWEGDDLAKEREEGSPVSTEDECREGSRPHTGLTGLEG